MPQFASSSTWDWVKVRERLTHWAAAHISPEAYAIDDVGFPKDGYGSQRPGPPARPGIPPPHRFAPTSPGRRAIHATAVTWRQGSKATRSANEAPPISSTGTRKSGCAF
ncbi:transposase [Streptomyces sp. NPDC001832]|uniref:transposase n=1 Tax=Streptomyces sp. NPDC001832 TaxID=3154527 RepID=UPI00332BE756